MTTTRTDILNGRARRSSSRHISLPVPPPRSDSEEEEAVYARFFRHIRHVPNHKMEIKILSSIQFTADFLNYSDAHVAKILVDLGLRAPRMAFPAEYLRFADTSLRRSGWEIGGPGKALQELRDYWDSIGEDRFAAARYGEYSLVREQAGV